MKNITLIGQSPTKKRIAISYSMIFLAAILYTVGIQGFMIPAKTFSAGFSALTMLPTYIEPSLANYTSLFYLALNLPMIIIFWNKLRRKFIYRTTFFVLVQTGLGALFFIPGLNDLFGNLLNIKLPTGYTGTEMQYIRDLQWPILVLGIIGAVMVAFSLALSYKYGGSTGGTDFITYFYSFKKQKSIGHFMFMISMGIVCFSFSTTIALNHEVRDKWLITLFTTLIYIMTTSIVVNFIFPKYKKMELTIVSEKTEEIIEALKKSDYPHSFRIEDTISVRSGKKKQKIVTVAFLLEVRSLIEFIKEIDPKVWISYSPVIGLVGQFNAEKLENNI